MKEFAFADLSLIDWGKLAEFFNLGLVPYRTSAEELCYLVQLWGPNVLADVARQCNKEREFLDSIEWSADGLLQQFGQRDQ